MSANSKMSQTETSPSQNKPRTAGEDIAFLAALFLPFSISLSQNNQIHKIVAHSGTLEPRATSGITL